MILNPLSMLCLISRRQKNKIYGKKNFQGVKKKYLTPFLFYSMMFQVMNMEKIVEYALLYDFYGTLLTEHQQRIYEDYVYQNYSIGEIAEEAGISRQGVHDLIKRCNRILEGYEEKLQLLSKFLSTKEKVNEISRLIKACLMVEQPEKKEEQKQILFRIERISDEILDSF